MASSRFTFETNTRGGRTSVSILKEVLVHPITDGLAYTSPNTLFMLWTFVPWLRGV